MTEHSYDRNLQGNRYCGHLWRPGIALIVVAAVFGRSSAAQEPADSVEFEIPQQSLASALLSFSEEANVQIIADASVIDGIQCASVSGSMPLGIALEALLDATGLTYEFSSARTVSVFSLGSANGRKSNVVGTGQVRFNQPAICSGDQRCLSLFATMRANARVSTSLQVLGRSARS